MKLLKLVIALFFTLLFTAGFSKGFEGTIDITKINFKDTSYYRYYVTQNKIKIDELDVYGAANGSIIIDLNNKKVHTMSSHWNLFMELNNNPEVKDYSNSKFIKTDETKEINGYDCTKWEVENTSINSTTSFWVVKQKQFIFFTRLLNIFEHKDNIAQLFLNIPENNNVYPMLSIEHDFDGNFKSKIETTRIVEKNIDKSIFNIPKDFREVQE